MLFGVVALAAGASHLWLLTPASVAAANPVTVKVELSPATIVAGGTQTSKATATVTKAGKPVAGQNVVFSATDPGIKLGPTTEPAKGTYVATLSASTTAGTTTITATDRSDPASGQATLTQTPGPATHIALTLQPTSIAADGNSFATATATLTDAHGNRVPTDTVTFSSSDRGERIQLLSNAGNGTYSALIRSSTTPGPATISATDIAARISASVALTQTVGGSSVSVVSFPSAAVTNEPVTLIATVSSILGPPSGTITFADGHGAALAGCAPKSVSSTNGTAICQTTFAASTSPEQLTATFSPNVGSLVAGSTARTSVSVSRDSTSTSVGASTTVNSGAPTTYIATVAPPAARPGPITPSGSVEFLDGGHPIAACAAQTLTSGQAACRVTYTAPGTHSITAQYSGDGNFVGSASAPAPVRVVSPVLGTIAATMQWSFQFGPTYTNVVLLSVSGAPPGGSVLLSCRGLGCPFNRRAIPVTKVRRCGPKGSRTCPTHGRVDLTPALRNHRLRAGARLNVRIVRRGWIGKYYMFTVRPRRGPRIQIACLAPGATRPGVGC
ncbi:MAG: Ig-like domain repeat protein [Solirubrobacterales bacterium]|nr:Ig-like domain repeat protein [Solirubrobacterales bacterium]